MPELAQISMQGSMFDELKHGNLPLVDSLSERLPKILVMASSSFVILLAELRVHRVWKSGA